MTTFTEKVEELLAEYGLELLQLQDNYPNYEISTDAEQKEYDTEELKLQRVYVKAMMEAHQAEISRRKEEWEKLRTQHEVGDIVGHYEITDRFKKVGKNTKYRVICKLCGAPMFRYSNRFKTNHKDCPAINKIKGEYTPTKENLSQEEEKE